MEKFNVFDCTIVELDKHHSDRKGNLTVVENGETLEEALIRECIEELDVKVKVGDIFMEVDHEYPDITVHLTLFNAVISEGEIKMLEHNDIRFIEPSEIPQYNFCPADKEILEKIIKDSR